MNILREVRRINKKSVPVRITLLLVFSVILIVNTYAWFQINQEMKLGGLEADVTPWDVSYYVNNDENEILDQTAIFTIDELYPGMPEKEDVVHIYNLGETSTSIKCEVMSIKLFGEEIIDQVKAENEIVTEGMTTSILADKTKYPFNITYTADRLRLDGVYVDNTTTPNANATIKFNANWTYEEGNNDAEKQTKDMLDTEFGKNAYEFYQNSDNDSKKAIEIMVRITSSMLKNPS